MQHGSCVCWFVLLGVFGSGLEVWARTETGIEFLMLGCEFYAYIQKLKMLILKKLHKIRHLKNKTMQENLSPNRKIFNLNHTPYTRLNCRHLSYLELCIRMVNKLPHHLNIIKSLSQVRPRLSNLDLNYIIIFIQTFND